MKRVRLFSFILAFGMLITPLLAAAADYPTTITITKMINNTPYDFPNIHLAANSTINEPQVFSFPSNRPYAYVLTSPVFRCGDQINALFNMGVNNFNVPYVGGEIVGLKNKVDFVVHEESATTFTVELSTKSG